MKTRTHASSAELPLHTSVPEKLQAIVEEIDDHGSGSLTRLTVPEKGFEHSGRLPAFGLWIAKRADSRKGKTKAAAGAWMDEVRALLGSTVPAAYCGCCRR